jgi:hypothetical protein
VYAGWEKAIGGHRDMTSFNTLALRGGEGRAKGGKNKLVMIPQLHDSVLLISIKKFNTK